MSSPALAFAAIAALAVVAWCAAANGEESVRVDLRLRLAQGASYRFRMTVTSDQAIHHPPSKAKPGEPRIQRTFTNAVVESTWSIDKVHADGAADLRIRFDFSKGRMDDSMLGEIVWDSAGPPRGAATTPKERLAANMLAVVGRAFVLTVQPDGAITGSALVSEDGTLVARPLGSDGQFREMGFPFAGETRAVGETWKSESPYAVSQVATTARFEHRLESADLERAVVASTAKLTLPAGGAAYVTQGKDPDGVAAISRTISRKDGLPLLATSSSNVAARMQVPSGEDWLDVEIRIVTKFERIDPPAAPGGSKPK